MIIPMNVAKAIPTEVNVAAFWFPPLVATIGRTYEVAAARMARLMRNDISRRLRHKFILVDPSVKYGKYCSGNRNNS